MDAIRRGAMVKLGQRAVGALGAGALMGGRGNLGSAEVAPPTEWPSDTKGYAEKAYAIQGQTTAPDPHYRAQKQMVEARYRAAQPLRDKLDALRGHSPSERFRSLENNIGLHQRTTDLPALRSTALWWRDSVAMDRAQKRLSAINQLENEWQKLVSSPLQELDETFRGAVTAFLAELQKP